MTEKLKTLEDWRKFMNGYRDPVSARENKALRDRWEDEDDDFTPMSSGGMSERECGHRKEGGTYAVVPTSANGTPVDDFLLCKPLRIDKDEYNLSNVGVRLIDVAQPCGKCGGNSPTKGLVCSTCGGTHTEIITHIFDIIGQEYYPNVADFIEETRRLGVSRRLELEDSKQYARLSSRSRLFCLHHRAIIINPGDILLTMGETEKLRLNRAGCPKGLPEHQIGGENNPSLNIRGGLFDAPGCSTLYWNVLEGAINIPEFNDTLITSDYDNSKLTERFVGRSLMSGQYRGYRVPEDVKVKTELGVFAIFPLGKIEVVDPSGEYEDRLARASSARLDVEAVDC